MATVCFWLDWRTGQRCALDLHLLLHLRTGKFSDHNDLKNLSRQNIKSILQTLIYDGKIECYVTGKDEISRKLYRELPSSLGGLNLGLLKSLCVNKRKQIVDWISKVCLIALRRVSLRFSTMKLTRIQIH